MKLGIYSACLPSLSPAEAIDAAAGAGYAGIEWRVAHDIGNSGTPHFLTNNRCTVAPEPRAVSDICTRTRAAELKVVALSPYVECGDVAGVEDMMRIARDNTVPSVRLRAPWMDDSGFHRLFADAREFFDHVATLAARYDVQALLEIHQRSLCPSVSLAHQLIGHLPPDRVGVIYDVGNLVVEGYEDHRMALQILGDHLAHVHVKNAQYVRPAGGGVWTHRWSPMDDGVADIPRVLGLLDEAGYRGWVSVEDFSDSRPVHERLHFNAEFLRQHADFETPLTHSL
ncbi:sugar phosphate isomerase/epimerase family protein [Rhodococcus sp. NPDC057014]|uniref:sugar phosphate isomerase/epimerase family protein n=1 Tax=unclassified Rhodococcus (in: high G+C Gram-positive bacteria) TaxID=192944 RepID=UPI00364592A6